MTIVDATRLRTFVYDDIVGRGRFPSSAHIGEHFGVSAAEARHALAELRIGKALLLDQETGEIWMAGPFSARRTPYDVATGERSWWANCAWDMFGIAHLLDVPVTVHTRCGDCGEPITVAIDPATPPSNALGVVHFFLPARQWYDDIGFT